MGSVLALHGGLSPSSLESSFCSFEFAYVLERSISFPTYLYVHVRGGPDHITSPVQISRVRHIAEVSYRYLEYLELLCDGH